MWFSATRIDLNEIGAAYSGKRLRLCLGDIGMMGQAEICNGGLPVLLGLWGTKKGDFVGVSGGEGAEGLEESDDEDELLDPDKYRLVGCDLELGWLAGVCNGGNLSVLIISIIEKFVGKFQIFSILIIYVCAGVKALV